MIISTRLNTFFLDITITGNLELTSIDFGSSKSFSIDWLVIENNPKLVSVKLPSSAKINVVVKGNRFLSEESLNLLKDVSSEKISKLQLLGECHLDEPVKSSEELKGCRNIIGDLVLDTEDDLSQLDSVIKVEGNVKVRKTASLVFLQDAEVTGQFG